MEQWAEEILWLHVSSTFFMLGLIWFVQIVHYPLFSRVGEEGFVEYESAHCRLTGFVVGPAMLLEAITALALLMLPLGMSRLWLICNVVCLGFIWLSTYFVQVPLHYQLSQSFDSDAHRRLVSSNWLRTILWSLRACLLFVLLAGR